MLDLTEVKTGNEVIPAGTYHVSLAEASVKETKDGTGEYINAKFQVMEGDYKGTTIYSMFNIKNKNPQATQIGHQQLKGFMTAAGFETFLVKSVTDLEGSSAMAVVKNKTDDYGEKAVISYFKPVDKASGTKADSNIPF